MPGKETPEELFASTVEQPIDIRANLSALKRAQITSGRVSTGFAQRYDEGVEKGWLKPKDELSEEMRYETENPETQQFRDQIAMQIFDILALRVEGTTTIKELIVDRLIDTFDEMKAVLSGDVMLGRLDRKTIMADVISGLTRLAADAKTRSDHPELFPEKENEDIMEMWLKQEKIRGWIQLVVEQKLLEGRG